MPHLHEDPRLAAQSVCVCVTAGCGSLLGLPPWCWGGGDKWAQVFADRPGSPSESVRGLQVQQETRTPSVLREPFHFRNTDLYAGLENKVGSD